jgi:hypothetical protein
VCAQRRWKVDKKDNNILNVVSFFDLNSLPAMLEEKTLALSYRLDVSDYELQRHRPRL